MNLADLERKIISCRRCPRLVSWRECVAKEKRAAYAGETYWGRPIVGFGDPKARLLVVGLAPGAHGANRTGRVFTGDQSGLWLYRALYRSGFANQPTAVSKDDGLRLKDAFITSVVRCVPPGNKPTLNERKVCASYLQRELDLLANVRVIVVLGAFAWEGLCAVLRERGIAIPRKLPFAHGAQYRVGPYHLLASYHPSQQNTFTGKLTQRMLQSVFNRAHGLLGLPA